MHALRVTQIAQQVVAFFLKNEYPGVSNAYRKLIQIYFPHFQHLVLNDEFLCEQAPAIAIVHSITEVPFPQQPDEAEEFLSDFFESTGLTIEEFGEWKNQIHKNNDAGMIFMIDTGFIKNPQINLN